MSDDVVRWEISQFNQGNSCVEVGFAPNARIVRDSNNRSGPSLRFTLEEWRVFVQGVKSGQFDVTED
jgi:hypothetical protein